VVALGGRLDTITAPEYEQRVRELIESGATRLVLDLDQLDYISSAGLRGLLTTAKLLADKGGQIRFANVKGNVKTVFDISKFATMFQLEASVAEAIAQLA
jgi:stage II sporulation protein AA (anti-sigma F factor antagonist)